MTRLGGRTYRGREVVIGEPAGRGSQGPLVLGDAHHLRSGTVLYTGSRIGDRLETGHHVVVREDCLLGDDVSIWSGSVIDYSCRIGDRVKIHTNCYVAQYTEIGDDAFLAPGVSIANDLYPGQQASVGVMSGPWIGPGAQLGVNVTVLPFVRIGAGALVGAGSVVTRDVRPGAVVFGNPAVEHGDVDQLRDVTMRVSVVEGSASRFRFAAESLVPGTGPAGGAR